MPRTHEQINHHLFAQIILELLHTDRRFEQIKLIYLLHVHGPLCLVYISKQSNLYCTISDRVMPHTQGANKSILFAQILDPYKVALSEFSQIKLVLFAHVY